MNQTNQKVVLITGCSSGLGKDLAALLASNNYKIYATMRDISRGGKLLEEIDPKDRHLIKIEEIDVTVDDSVSTTVQKILDQEGRIDILVNNAGYSLFGGIEQVSMEDVTKQFDTNLMGVIRMMKAVIPSMRSQRSGTIINLSSIGGVWGQPFNDIYCASKFALEGLCESMSSVYRQFGVKIVLVEPGAIKTSFLANAKKPDMSNVHHDFHQPIQQVANYYSSNESSNTAQTGIEVAQVCLSAIEDEDPPLRLQTNPRIEGLFTAKLSDVTGRAQVRIAEERFFETCKS